MNVTKYPKKYHATKTALLTRKANSPAIRTYTEGGSLATARMRPRSKCSKSK